jgi:hypothetical protein
MGHIGNTVQTAFTSFDKQTITGTGGTTYTLTHSVANEREIEVFVNNVRQEPSVAYNVSGNTLTMTGNVASTDDFYVVYQGKAVQTVVPADNTVTSAMLQSGSVTSAKLASGAVFTPSYAVVSDQKTSGTAGGASSTSFVTRDLNTVVFDPDNIVTVASNQFTLIAGTYIIEWQCPHFRSNTAKTVLYDITGSATIETGTSSYSAGAANYTVGLSTGIARVVITANNTYDIRMKCSLQKSANGFGVAANSTPETYSVVKITKIA